jgi:sugar O-acyltransferase (sialic acid O-acetyltransferase NeuD family)
MSQPVEKPKLVIVGAGEFAEIACEYFTYDSQYEVVGFGVEREFLSGDTFFGRPLVALDEISTRFPPATHDAFVAVTYTRLNRVRARLFAAVKALGYRCASYVSSRAFMWHTVELGENVFVFEQNVLQHGVRVADDVVLWSGNHIGHRSVIERHCYLASHVVVSGYCTIGEHSFIGVNVTLADHVTVGRDCVIGAGVTLLKTVGEGLVFQGQATEPSRVGSRRFYRLREDE